MTKFFSNHKKSFVWLCFGLFSLLLVQLARLAPSFVETVYSRSLFVGLRWIWDHTLGFFPLPLLYIAIVALLFWLIFKWIKRPKKQLPFHQKALIFLFHITSFLMGMVGLFFWLWGFNYYRIKIEDQLQLSQLQPDKEIVYQEVERMLSQLEADRRAVSPSDSIPFSIHQLPAQMEGSIRKELEIILSHMQFPVSGRVRVRRIFPKGALMGMGATGIYIPFVGEGHFDAALLPVQHPSVLAHEMSHGYGFTDEGVCNFLALLACERAAEPLIRYSGGLMYFRYLVHDLFLMDPAHYRLMMANLPPGIATDLDAIKQNRQQYPSWFPSFSRKVYNRYLKSQGIKEGLQSYNRVVGLYLEWRKMNGKLGLNN